MAGAVRSGGGGAGAGLLGLVLREAQEVDAAREIAERSAFARCVLLGSFFLGRLQAHRDGRFVHEADFPRKLGATTAAGGMGHAINIRTVKCVCAAEFTPTKPHVSNETCGFVCVDLRFCVCRGCADAPFLRGECRIFLNA